MALDQRIAVTINSILVHDGLLVQDEEQIVQVNCKDIGAARYSFYHFPNSEEFHLEIHTAIYGGGAGNAPFAVNISVFIRLPHGGRTFCASKFIADRQDEQALREQIEDLLKIPTHRLESALSLANKCLGNDLIRANILKYLGPRDVTKLEGVCTWFQSTLLSRSVDTDFWRPHFQKEFGNDALASGSGLNQSFRAQYIARKKAARAAAIARLYHPRSPGSPSIHPNLPDPVHPLLYPAPQPMSRRPRPFPPIIGDVDNHDNWLPHAFPEGDPRNMLPNAPSHNPPDPELPSGPRRGGGNGGFDPFGQRFGGGGSGMGNRFGGGGSFI